MMGYALDEKDTMISQALAGLGKTNFSTNNELYEAAMREIQKLEEDIGVYARYAFLLKRPDDASYKAREVWAYDKGELFFAVLRR